MTKSIRQTLAVFMVLSVMTFFGAGAFAKEGHITGKTVVAGALSLLIWPGIGQAVNKESGDKVATHAIIGLFPPYRFWSGYDALVDRQGGYWHGRI
jgi:hypothetical protein